MTNKLIFDGHGDVWTDITCRSIDHGERDIFRQRHLAKFKEGSVGGGIFVIWIDPPYDQDPVKRAKQICAAVRQEKEDAKDIIQVVRRFEDFEKGTAAGKINVVTGMEGLSEIGEDIDQINWYYEEMDVRHAMLSWNETNALATGWPGDKNRGLTKKGKEAVSRIHSLGMVMDVSHLNDRCFWDVIECSDGHPVIASHSNSRTICPHMRNLSDEMIRAIAKTGGLLGMNSMREFIAEDKANQTVSRLADHVEYIVNLVGPDYVGLGFDFDDYLEADALSAFSGHIDSPSGDGIGNEAEAKNIITELASRGYKQEDLEKIAYGNYYRVFKEVWK